MDGVGCGAGRSACRALVVSMAVLLLTGLAAAGASASTWRVAQLGVGPVQAAFYGVSCPTASFCVAVGGNSTVAASSDPAGPASSWRVGQPGGGAEIPGAGIYGGGQIRGVSCPTTGLCVAVSLDGRFFSTTNPAGGPGAWKVVEQAASGPNIHLFGVSCPTVGFCVAVGYGGKVLHSTNPTGDSADWVVTELAQPFDFRGVSCPTASSCVAVDNRGSIVASSDPRGGASAWSSAGAPAGVGALNGISCPSTSLCVTGNAGQILTSTNPAGGAASWDVAAAGTGLSVTGVSCPSVSACAAFDDNADAMISTDPTGGPAAWSFENVIPYDSASDADKVGDGVNGTFGLSCPTTTLCAAVGQGFRIITSTDPFAKERPSGRPTRDSKRPRAIITRHPAKRVDMRKGGVRVAFGFRAIGDATGFRCKLDDRPFRPCRSPKRYRVRAGKHAFKVRAIAPGGATGRGDAFHFRVGGLIERPPAGSCPPGTESNINNPCIAAD